MSQETKSATTAPLASDRPIPKNLPIELLPLYDWWRANGSQFLITLVAAAILFGGSWLFVQYRTSKSASGNKALLQASSVEELESVVAKYGSAKTGNAARLRLAKAYYDASNYEEALNAYTTCLSKGAPSGFVEIARLGRAHTLEALNRLDEALAAYETFEKESPTHFLLPQAKMGIARIYTLQGKKDEALKLLENLKAQKTDNSTWEMVIANLEGVIKRYEPRAARSLFDSANEAAKSLQPAAPASHVVPSAPAAPVAPVVPSAKK